MKHIYFLQAGTAGPIKIGVASNVQMRIASLQTGCPAKLTLLAQMPGDNAAERALHHKLAAHRLEGEWFRPSIEVLREVDAAAGLSIEVTDEHLTRLSFTGILMGELAHLPDWERLVAEDAGVDLETVQSWLGLERSPAWEAVIRLSKKHAAIQRWATEMLAVWAYANDNGVSAIEACRTLWKDAIP